MNILQIDNIQFSLFDAISLFAICQGIVISGFLIFSKEFNIPTKKYFVMLILTCVSINIFELIYRLGIVGSATPFWVMPISFFPLIIPTTYFILKYYLTLESKVSPWEYSLYLLFCLAVLHELFTGSKYIWGNLNTKEIRLYSNIDDYIMLILEFINGIVCIIIFSYFFFQIRKHKQKIYDNFIEFKPRSLSFILITLLGGMGLAITSTSIALLDFSREATSINPHDRTALEFGITILIYWFSYGLIMYPELSKDAPKDLSQTNNETEKDPIRIANDQLSDKTEEYHARLLIIMSEKAPYRDPDFNLDSLAEEMNLSKSYVSKIINNKEGKNFFDFVNYYRVEEVKQKLKDESFDHFSIIAIASEAGFKSKSTFNTVFKKMTGMPPSKYKEIR